MFLHFLNRWAWNILMITILACSSSNEKEDNGPDSSDASKDSAEPKQTDGGMDADIEDGGSESDADITGLFFNCPNSIVEEDLHEECDDGNYFDDDGCTQLCEYTCTTDKECNDLNDCNGVETCAEDHTCTRGEYADDGVECSTNKSCFAGLCRDDVCGDKKVNPGLNEECDDGNPDNDDGCTTECNYTCSSDEDCQGGESCSGATVCNLSNHTCGGDPLEDETTCQMEDGKIGWCFNQVCVPTQCGDEAVGGEEECDLGKDNGKKDSGCSADCKYVICDDGQITADEECDDGGHNNYDGCDEDCKAELFFRWSYMQIIRDPAPEWCKYKGKNAFAKAFPEGVSILGVPIDILARVNGQIAAGYENCSMNTIIQILDLDDFSFRFTDDSVRIASHRGELAEGASCEYPMEVDTPFYIGNEYIDENGDPIAVVDLVQRPGLIQLKEPITISVEETEGASGASTIHDFSFLMEIDTDTLDTPDGVSESIRIPKTMGGVEDSDNDTVARGWVCGAMNVIGLASQPVTEGQGGGDCCSANGEKYHVCEEGDVPGEDCDSTLDIISKGCQVCIDLDIPGVSDSCDNCDLEFEVIHPSPPDIDVDGDGDAEALSIVFAAEAVRIDSLGVK